MSNGSRFRRQCTVAFLDILLLSGLFATVYSETPHLSPDDRRKLLRERDRMEYLTGKRDRTGQFDEAIAYAERMLAVERQVLGNAHPDTAGSLRWLAELHLEKGEYPAAKGAITEALSILAPRNDSKDKFVDCQILQNEIDRKSRLTAAERALLGEARDLYRKAEQAARDGKTPQAIEGALRSVELHRQLFGDSSQPYFVALVFAARMYSRNGDDQAAERFFREVYDRSIALAGTSHNRTIQASQMLRDCLERQAQAAERSRAFDEARRTRSGLVEICRAENGDDHWRTRVARSQLADVDVQQRMPPDVRKSLEALMVRTDELYASGAASDAVESARQLVANCRELAGAEKPVTRAALVRLAKCALEAGSYGESVDAARQARAIDEKLYSLDAPSARDWLEAFAEALERVAGRHLDKVDLIQPRMLLEEKLAIKVALFGNEHAEVTAVRQTLDYLDRLARLDGKARKRLLSARKLDDEIKKQVALRRFDDALSRAELAASVRNETLGEDHPEYATALVQLASVHINRNELERGLELVRKATAITRAALGPDNRALRNEQLMLAHFLRQLSDKHVTLQNYAAAVEVLRERQSILQELHGPQDWRVRDAELDVNYTIRLGALSATDRSTLSGAARLEEMAWRQFSAGRYDESAPFTEQALEMRQKVFQDLDSNGPRDLVNLGTVLQKVREYDRAELAYQKALALRRKQVGDEHPHYVENLNALADLEIEREQFDRAAEYRWEAYALSRDLYGARDWRTTDRQLAFDRSDNLSRMSAATRRRLAETAEIDRLGNEAYSRRDDAGALELAVEAWTIRREIFGDGDVDTLKSLKNLARIDRSLFSFSRAESRYREALAGFERRIGRYHPLYADTLQELADLLVQRGQSDKAAPLQRELVDIDEKLDVNSGWRTQASALRLSRLEMEVGVEREAPNQLRRASELEQAARDQQREGQLDAAVESLRMALAIRSRLLGDDDPDTKNTRMALSRLLEDLASQKSGKQNYADSERVWNEIAELRRADSDTQRWLVRQAEDRAAFQRKLSKMEHGERETWRLAGDLERNADAIFTSISADQAVRALEDGERALRSIAKLFGADSLAYAYACYRQGDRYYHRQAMAKAIDYYRQAAALQKSNLGPESADYQSTMKRAALCLQQVSATALDQNDFRAALAAQEECLVLRREYPGPDDPLTIVAADGLRQIRTLQSLNTAQRTELERANHLADEGGRAYQLGRPQEALPRQQEAVTIFKRLLGDDSQGYASSLKDLASIYRALGQTQDALAALEEGLKSMRRALGERHPMCAEHLEALCDVLSDAGNAALQADDPRTAQKYFERALAERERFYTSRNDYRLIWSRLFVVLAEKFARLTDREWELVAEARRLAAKVQEQTQNGQLDQAIETALALRTAREAVWGKDHFLIRDSLLLLGRLYHEAGEYDRAEPLYQEALDLTRRILGARRPEDADVLELLGKLYSNLGDRQRSGGYFEEALGIRQQVAAENVGIRHLQNEAMLSVASSLGAMVEGIGAEEARGFLDSPQSVQFLTMMKQMNELESPALIDFLKVYARLHQVAGYLDRAEELLFQAETVIRRLGGAESPEFVIDQLELAIEQGKYSEAERFGARAVGLIEERAHGQEHPDYGRTLTRMAEIYEATGRTSKAREALVRAMQVERKVLGRAFGVEGEWGMRSYLSKAGASRDMLISIAHRHAANDPQLVDDALTSGIDRKGIEFDALCRAREARALGAQEPAVAARLRRLRELQQRLANLAVKPHIELTLAAQQAELQSLRAQVDRTSQEVDQHLAGKLRKLTAEGADRATLQSLRARLPPRSALVEYVKAAVYQVPNGSDRRRWLDPHYFAFVLTSDPAVPPRLYDLGDADEIERLVIKLRDEFSEAPNDLATSSEAEVEGILRETSHALYAAVFEGLRSSLGDAQTVFLAPDGELNRVPFAALATAGNGYLVDDYRFAYLSTGRDLLRKSAVTGHGTVVFADPSYKMDALRRQKAVQQLVPNAPQQSSSLFSGHLSELRGLRLPHLEETKHEAEFIQRELANSAMSPVTLFTKDEALEDVLKAQRSPRILHLATHGFFLDSRDWFTGDSSQRSREGSSMSGMARLRANRNPLLRSGVFLAGANDFGVDQPGTTNVDDGLVLAEEISLLDLRGTELVVLSACESGLGDIVAGEGVFGLRRAFQFAGARTLVTSLFKVPDAATREIMEHFYASMKSGKSKLSSLHEAQIAVRAARRATNGSAHPYFWSSFVLVGDPE